MDIKDTVLLVNRFNISSKIVFCTLIEPIIAEHWCSGDSSNSTYKVRSFALANIIRTVNALRMTRGYNEAAAGSAYISWSWSLSMRCCALLFVVGRCFFDVGFPLFEDFLLNGRWWWLRYVVVTKVVVVTHVSTFGRRITFVLLSGVLLRQPRKRLECKPYGCFISSSLSLRKQECLKRLLIRSDIKHLD